MNHKSLRAALLVAILIALLPAATRAQQTLGSINGTVTDTTGGVVQGATVKVHNVDTGLEQTATTKNDGSFSIVDLPIGTYSVTLTKGGFKTEVYSQILVQGNRTTTVNASLQPGEVSTSVTVTATPLLNETDTTNGYTLSPQVIQAIPLGTGSFTQLAILSPGVNADLLNTSGTNAGLGNQEIFANGQRSSSNSFTVNGINSNNLFNGNSSSQVTADRLVFNTGESFLGDGTIATSTSVFNGIGEALPSPPPETIEELHVNTSMYDASQGGTSGAHIELTTKSGTNEFHGQLYEYHQTSAWNAAPFFRNANAVKPAVPDLHRNTFGGNIGGPIFRDKLFFFGSYQGVRVSDALNGTSNVALPKDLTNARDAGSLANVANLDFFPGCGPGQTPPNPCLTAAQIDPVALKIMQAPAPVGGGFFVPTPNDLQAFGNGFDAVLQGAPARFTADQVNGNVDYNVNAQDRLAAKYYYQHDPTFNPFSESQLFGFGQNLKAGSQVVSLENTTTLTPNLIWEQHAGFIREVAYATTSQGLSSSDVGINLFGDKRFPSILIGNVDGSFDSLTIGPLDNFSNAGIFQNQFEWASSLNWVRGRHTFAFGFNFNYTQLNVINKNDQLATIAFADFPSFLTGSVTAGLANSIFVNGSANRYYRSKQTGAFIQDNVKTKRNLTLNLGLRFDWDGPLTEKYGRLTNFDARKYSYDLATDTITNIGLIVAGNNKQFATPGASNSTLTGRQWGFAPRIGVVWSPEFLKNIVIRAGFGLYYNRGEYFTELSPASGFGVSGPFGVTTTAPFSVLVPDNCTGPFAPGNDCFANPFGTTPPPAPPSNLSGVASLLPNQANLIAQTTPFCQAQSPPLTSCAPFIFGGYDPRNTLPYSENWNLDVQWQPWNTLVMTMAYVGNHGVHGTIPIPFNEPRIASAQNPVNGQIFSYGFNIPGVPQEDPAFGGIQTSTGGNTDLRVPFIGYNPNSEFYKAEGTSHYNALQFGVNKRLSGGLQVNGSYTWSHSLDEQSGLGLFYNGNDPLNPKSAYGNSDFDRTHVFTVSYLYQFPTLAHASAVVNTIVNGWGFSGITVLESGQPYSPTDFSGAAASIFFSKNDAITNPIVPLAPGQTPQSAQLQGTTGVNAGKPVLNPAAFTFPTPFAPGGPQGVPPCSSVSGTLVCDNFETAFGAAGRNLFRGPFQSRFDFSVKKDFKLTERLGLKYSADIFNLFNHPSFDVPNNNVLFNLCGTNPPKLNTCFSPVPAGSAAIGFATPPTPPGGRLGQIQHTIGSPRFIQMSLHLTF